MEEIKDQSNKYAREVMGQEKYQQWTEVTVAELSANPKSSILDYWQKDAIHHYPPIADRISRDRYRDISRYLHFADNSKLSPPGIPNYDRLGKIRPVVNYL